MFIVFEIRIPLDQPYVVYHENAKLINGSSRDIRRVRNDQ